MPRSLPHFSIGFIALLLAALLSLCGCFRTDSTPAPTAVPAESSDVIPIATAAQPTPKSSLSEGRTVSSTLTLSEEQLSAASDSGPLLCITAGGDLTASGLIIDRAAGAAAPSLSIGEQAAVLVQSGGRATLSGGALASGASDVPLLGCFDSGQAMLSDTMAVLSGNRAAALLASDGGSIRTLRCDLFAGGTGSACLQAETGGSIVCADNTRLSAAIDGSSTAIHLSSGGNVSIENGAVSGDISIEGEGNTLRCTNTRLSGNVRFDNAEDEIDLQLLGGSTFLGTTDGDGAIGIRITLDAASRWVLTGDAYVAALIDADETLSNIDSSGFSLYYNAESEENLWLGGKSLALIGGGYLIPLI